LVASVFLVAAVSPFSSVGAAVTPTESYVVVLQPSSTPVAITAAQLLAPAGSTTTAVYERAFDGFAVDLTPAQAASLATDPRVDAIEPDLEFHADAQVVPTGLDRIGASTNPALQIDGVDTLRVDADVAVLDSGIDLQHPDLNVVGGVDCVAGPTCVAGGDDVFGHGTHVAGIIGALDNGIGVVGVAPGARLWAVKVLDANGIGSLSSILRGLDWVLQHSATIDVVNMSFGAPGTSQAMRDSIQASTNNGVMFAAAAGNGSTDASGFVPAALDNVLTVSALADFDGRTGGIGAATCLPDVDDTLANFSNRGAVIDITAPGACVQSTLPIESGSYGMLSGTSMASPHVAGAMALIAGRQRPTTAAQVSQQYATLLAAGKQDWVDDSGDGVQEPRLDVSSPILFQAGAAAPCAPASATGLVGWWRGDGSTAAAAGPALTGASAFGTGVAGQGFSLTGATSLVANGVAASNGLSVSMWVKPVNTGLSQTLIGRWDFPSVDDTSRSFTVQLGPQGTLTFATDETSSRRPLELRAAAPTLFDGVFHHVAATWSQTTVAIYVDGTLVASTPSQGGTLNPASGTPLRIGSEGGPSSNAFPASGVIDEPAIWNRALTADEIRAIVAAGSSGLCPVA
jgi:subtilisin family serine protease